MRPAILLVGLVAACGDNLAAPLSDAAIPIQDAAVDAPGSALAAVPLTTPDGTYYNAPLSIGGTTFLLDVDTGSTTTAVAGATCSGCAGIAPVYMPGATASDEMHTASTFYEDGSGWRGEVFEDDVGFGLGTPDVRLRFGSMTRAIDFFDGNVDQGILGLGPSELLEPYTTSIVDRLTEANEVPTFSFELCPTRGTMWVGGYDPSAAAPGADVQYAPMLPIDHHQPWYALDLQDLAMGGTSLGFGSAMLGLPIVDTGTTDTYIPLAAENAMLAAANAAPGYATVLAAPLTQTAGHDHDGCVAAVSGATAAMVDAVLPRMSMTFPTGNGTDTFTLTMTATQSYLYDGGDGTFCLAIFDDGGEGGLLGDSFLRSFITVVDVAGKRIGFAPDAGCAVDAKRAGRVRMHEHNPHRPHRVRPWARPLSLPEPG
ncbi:MAG TPA: pepsin-like aspartic protease [Kofleriaceae bacterium]|nr:pepsin-like aspartic protease [Kofleriaceae bacterium]